MMCMVAPGKVVAVKEKTATIDYIGEKRKARIEDVKVKRGDYVLVSAGFIVRKISEKDALESIRLLK